MYILTTKKAQSQSLNRNFIEMEDKKAEEVDALKARLQPINKLPDTSLTSTEQKY